MNIISIWILYFIDKLWNLPNVGSILKFNKIFNFLLKHNILPISYMECLLTDVVEDNPHKAIQIFNNNITKYKTIRFLRYRMAYLLARDGELKKANYELKNDLSYKAKIFKTCLNNMIGSFTMTDTLFKITEKYGVHEHFGCIETLVRKNKLKVGAEIGIFMGYHSRHLLEACRNVSLYCVDLYSNISGNGYDDWNQFQFDNLYNSVKLSLKKYGRTIFLRMKSDEAVNIINNNKLDFVYIDADHRYKSVKKDIIKWEKKVKPGGIISGHDYGQKDWPGVKIAVDEWIKSKSNKLYISKGHVWWIKK